jgi:hypothetical protein
MSHFARIYNRDVLYFLLGLVIGVTFDIRFIAGAILSYIIYRYYLYGIQSDPSVSSIYTEYTQHSPSVSSIYTEYTQHSPSIYPVYIRYIWDIVKNIFRPD